MVDESRQVPAPSAAAWRIDAGPLGGPGFVVLRLGEEEARGALVVHLVEIGTFADADACERAVFELPAESVSVLW